ncbi:MAG: hypothetical protein FJX45_18170 [Alphaproteobacteria bacterium]|nr:hypothetical protein [Alphaproteobacteria bacterium]
MSDPCPICRAALNYFTVVDGFDYFDCSGCGSILIEPAILASIDAGRHLRTYDESYWSVEIEAARHRAYGSSLARFAELMLYARRPVRRFVDIAAGPGLLLDSLATYLPASTDRFFAVEMFPPPEHTTNPNFYVGPLREITGTFDAGVCIEALEHLTPTMAAALAEDIASKSEPDSIYLFNTGMPQFVRASDPSYLDPLTGC